jgi:ATP-dependent Clp protease ATP-binding subunit ClpC
MFHLYTHKARRAICFARYEAGKVGSRQIESGHLLLGLIREETEKMYRFMGQLVSPESIRKEIDGEVTLRRRRSTAVDIPLSPECRKILRHAEEEALQSNHSRVDSEHLLLGILREEGSLAAQIVKKQRAAAQPKNQEKGD